MLKTVVRVDQTSVHGSWSIVLTYSTDNSHNPASHIIIQRVCLHTDGL